MRGHTSNKTTFSLQKAWSYTQAQHLKKKVVRPIFFVGGGYLPYIFRYMHKDKFLCIFSQIKNNAYLPVHLVHAPRFWWSSSYSFTFSFLSVSDVLVQSMDIIISIPDFRSPLTFYSSKKYFKANTPPIFIKFLNNIIQKKLVERANLGHGSL